METAGGTGLNRAPYRFATVQSESKPQDLNGSMRHTTLKGEIGLRPIWHVKQDRIRAHLFLAVLAYHGVHLLRTLLQRQGIHTSWAGIRNRLAGWMRVTTTMQTNAGELVSIRQDTLADAEEAALARAVGIEPQLHRQRRRTRLRQLPES